jgi:ADP-ribosylglycohydrolase
MQPSCDQFTGCLLGLALGDALGAPYEGGPVERLAWRIMGKTRSGDLRWTDDTQMSLDLAESLVENRALRPDDVAARFARSYRWSRGYGPGAAKLLRRIRRGEPWQTANKAIYAEGSFGNGAAMRAPVIGLFCSSDDRALPERARESAIITHAHPLGLEGAVLIAAATAQALAADQPREILAFAWRHASAPELRRKLGVALKWLDTETEPSEAEVGHMLGRGISAVDSCVTAIYLACRFLRRPFLELQGFVAQCGGDADTIGAMAGALWGAANGCSALPKAALSQLEERERIQRVAEALYAVVK